MYQIYLVKLDSLFKVWSFLLNGFSRSVCSTGTEVASTCLSASMSWESCVSPLPTTPLPSSHRRLWCQRLISSSYRNHSCLATKAPKETARFWLLNCPPIGVPNLSPLSPSSPHRESTTQHGLARALFGFVLLCRVFVGLGILECSSHPTVACAVGH